MALFRKGQPDPNSSAIQKVAIGGILGERDSETTMIYFGKDSFPNLKRMDR
jgi:hypothetical protein